MAMTRPAVFLAAACLLGFGAQPAHAQGNGDTALAQSPLFLGRSYPPLNMLVMGRDHKMYYEAYNDASDLDADGVLDVGYKPDHIDYYGYFHNNACYRFGAGVFKPVAAAVGNRKKRCDGSAWSGDFLNYLSTSRMDAIRRVLYGGTRVVDSAGRTVLQGAYIPRDAHSWGKAYDPARDAAVYRIEHYAPLKRPAPGTRHLFAVTTTGEAGDQAIPRLRVLNDSAFQVWEWVSKEAPVAQDRCGARNAPCARGGSAITDYLIRVEACSSAAAGLRASVCKPYPNHGGAPVYKPTGLLHDFGENEKMYFGLLTGSYQKNIAGGMLRRNVSRFTEEVDLQTGQFRAGANGVVANIDRQKVVGFDGRLYRECGWVLDGPISALKDPSRCAMWGSPLAEMMFEAMRYFAGERGPHSAYDYTDAGSRDKALGLAKPGWVAPYKPAAEGGGGYPHCARPVMTLLNDINPSYDAALPGSRYEGIAAQSDGLRGFDASAQARAVGAAEGIHGKSFFIGQSTPANADAAPTVKRVDDFSFARGLSPEEPSKEGTFYAAGVARFGATHSAFGNGKGRSSLMTYSVAIASPLPEIRFPVGRGRHVTISPYAKSVTGGRIDAARFAPTNQIVDYYVVRIANTGAADRDAAVNGGRPYAEFRINYEDVEQGADHDMDAISRYVVALQADGTVRVDMASEYASGSIGQHMGYVISGTTRDGLYLEVRDRDTRAVYYPFNTPAHRAPGYCVGRAGDAECRRLGLTASRTFAPSSSSTLGMFLKDPLWYAAKYGMPGRDPATVQGDPGNYFLVTNATLLKESMTKAFNDIVQKTRSVTRVSVDNRDGSIRTGADIYRTRFEADGWVGDVIRERLTQGDSGRRSERKWSAARQLAHRRAARKIFYAGAGSARPVLRPFDYEAIAASKADAAWLAALDVDPNTSTADGKARQRIAFLRGESEALRKRKKLPDGQANLLGDIVNSSLVRVSGARYRASAADRLEGTRKYSKFARHQASQPEMIYVGANDGMLHAFDADTGEEAFAFIPTALRQTLGLLTAPDYGKKDGTAHRYFVDGTSAVADVYFDDAWHKVLLGSLGAGGREVFALDITEPRAPKLLWEFQGHAAGAHPDMGYALSRPTIARLNDPASGKGRWVALLPNGYQAGNSSAGRASLFVLDISSGRVIRRFDMDSGMTAGELQAALPMGNGLSRLNAVDRNGDGKVDVGYAGDLAGNVWRFDLRSGDSRAWRVQRFFTARDAGGRRQPITAAPFVVDHPTGKGDLVIFGSGRFLTASDKRQMQRQTIHGIWDRHADGKGVSQGALPTAGKRRSDLRSQLFYELKAGSGHFGLTGHAVQWYRPGAKGTTDADVQQWGWYADLPRKGEKMVYDLFLYGRGLFFTTVRTSDNPCDAGLRSTLYAIDPNTGGRTDYRVFDMNSDGAFDDSDQVGGGQVNGTDSGSGKSTIHSGHVFNPDAQAERQVASGVESGRQSWRRQPPNRKQ